MHPTIDSSSKGSSRMISDAPMESSATVGRSQAGVLTHRGARSRLAGRWLAAVAAVLTTAVATESGAVLMDLGTLGGTSSNAVAINDAGQVVGSAWTAGNAENHAFLYSDGVMIDLGTLGGTYSGAIDINDTGQVVGISTTVGDTEQHGFLYSGGVMTDLGTLGGTYSFPRAINAVGQVAGSSHIAGDAEQHGFLYNGGVMTDLGTLGGTQTEAFAINAAGQVVGYSSIAGDTEYRAFISTACGDGVLDSVEVLPPLQVGVDNLVKKGQVIPVRMRVLCNGQTESGLTPAIQLFKGDKTGLPDSAPDVLVAESVSGADTNGVMREAGSTYIYNLRVPSSSNSGPLVKGDELTIRIRPFAPNNTSSKVTDIVLQIRK